MGRKPDWQKEIESAFKRFEYETLAPNWVLEGRNHQTVRPQTQLEAMMMTAPGQHEPLLSDRCNKDPYTQLENTLNIRLNLSEEERKVIDATIISGLSIREAADTLGYPATTVHRLKHSALNRIRGAVGGDTGDEPDDRGAERNEAGPVRSDPDRPSEGFG